MRASTTFGLSLRSRTSRARFRARASAGSRDRHVVAGDVADREDPQPQLKRVERPRRISAVSRPRQKIAPPSGARRAALRCAASMSVASTSALAAAFATRSSVVATGRPPKTSTGAPGDKPSAPMARVRVSSSRLFDRSTRASGAGAAPATARIGSSQAPTISAAASVRSVQASRPPSR